MQHAIGSTQGVSEVVTRAAAAGPEVDASFLDETAAWAWAWACCLMAVSLPARGEVGPCPWPWLPRLVTSTCTQATHHDHQHALCNSIHPLQVMQ